MAKKGRKGKSPKRAARAANVNRALVMRTPAMELGCSLADPWSCSACIPDGSRGTGCFTVKQQFTLSTGTGTCASFVFNPRDLVSFSFTDSGSTAATPTLPAASTYASAVNIATIKNIYGSSRLISAGLRGGYIGNTQTDGGVILFGKCSGAQSANIFNGETLPNAAGGLKEYDLVPLRNGIKGLTWRPESMMDSMQWLDFGASALTLNARSPGENEVLYVFVYNANASQALLSIEVVAHYEGQVINNTFAAIQSQGTSAITAPKIESGWYEKALTIADKVPSISSTFSMTDALGAAVGAARLGLGYYTGGFVGALGTLANGLPAPGNLGKSLMGSQSKSNVKMIGY